MSLKEFPSRRTMRLSEERAGIQKADVMDFGGNPGCPGCTAANRGMRRNHSDTCRKRMEGFMAKFGDIRIERYAQRVAEETDRPVTRHMRDEGDMTKEEKLEG